jgi:hypothetical protein
VRKQPSPSFSSLPSCAPCRRSPAGDRSPPSAPCRHRRLTHPCKHMFKFAKSPPTRRHFPHVFSWPERCFGRRRRPPPPRAAALALAGAGSRWIGRRWPRSNRPAGQTGHIPVNWGIKVKEPPSPRFFNFTCRSFHLERPLQFSPKFYVLVPVLLEFHTRGPEHPFYDLDLLFLGIIMFEPLFSYC